MSVRAVLFDYGGTLDSDGIPWVNRFFLSYCKAGLQVSQEDFGRAFHASDDHLASRFRLTGLGLKETIQLQVRCTLETLAPDRMDAVDLITQEFLSGCRAHFTRSRRVLQELRQRYPLGVVSNFYGNLDSVLASEGLLEYFSVVADSTAVGSLKPDSGIFLYATRRLGISPTDAYMVGDSLERDMRGAEALGMRHAWLMGPQTAQEGCCPQVDRPDSLQDLLRILEQPTEASKETSSFPSAH